MQIVQAAHFARGPAGNKENKLPDTMQVTVCLGKKYYMPTLLWQHLTCSLKNILSPASEAYWEKISWPKTNPMMDCPMLIIWENVLFQSSLLKPHFWAGSLFGRLLCGKELINIKDMCGLLLACVFQGWLLKLSVHCCCLIGFLRTRTPGGLSISWKYRPASASSGLGDLILSGMSSLGPLLIHNLVLIEWNAIFSGKWTIVHPRSEFGFWTSQVGIFV